ncbi:hypothetical protein LCGC14_1503110, partial [marine sediment metagenome]
KIEKTVIGLALILSVISLIVSIPGKQAVGNIFVEENAYSSAVIYTSSTLTNDTATLLVSRATSSRTYAQICFREDSANNVPIKIFKQATSTGIATTSGHPIYASSTSMRDCFRVDMNDPYTGQIWAISAATTSASIEVLQE